MSESDFNFLMAVVDVGWRQAVAFRRWEPVRFPYDFRSPEEKHQDEITEAHEWHQEWVDGCSICDAERDEHLREIL